MDGGEYTGEVFNSTVISGRTHKVLYLDLKPDRGNMYFLPPVSISNSEKVKSLRDRQVIVKVCLFHADLEIPISRF